MLLLALLLQATAPAPAPDGPDIEVRAPLPPQPQAPATMMVEPAGMLIAACDRDGDAMVDKAEMNACLAAAFDATPGRQDGGLRYIAYGDWALTWLGDRAALPSPYEVDRNNDDRVTLTELQDHFGRLFARYDRDGDRLVSRAELLTLKAAPIGGQRPAPAKPPEGERPRGRPPRR